MRAPIGTAPSAARQSGAVATASGPGDVAPHRCRNCGAEATGNYCPACGQETDVALPPAGTFLREAAGRYVSLDSRLLRSLHALLFRPAFLTREYLVGRRRRYVRPARLLMPCSSRWPLSA